MITVRRINENDPLKVMTREQLEHIAGALQQARDALSRALTAAKETASEPEDQATVNDLLRDAAMADESLRSALQHLSGTGTSTAVPATPNIQ